MSGSRPKGEGHLAEQHLGDRLSALVDGELGHEARDRVLAHVATCPKCKTEVDAQRRLKNVFAEAAPPTPSESFLARLQGLPGGGPGPGSGGGLPSGVFDTGRDDRFAFGYVPASPPGHGPRGQVLGRHESDRPSSRGLRFAFAAAGAVSLAAVALGGVTAGMPDATSEARGSGGGSNVTPARSPSAGAATSAEAQRRRVGAPLLGQVQGVRTLGDVPTAPTEAAAPLLPGLRQQAMRALTAPVTAGAAVMSPLIRPLEAVPPSWTGSTGALPTPVASSPFRQAP
ncbi:zf-HC2 domain-containing protein [Streptomyces sp. NPDC003717]|uniref:zf-HC2 domain-containing protein n=1 Tax=Streptomyces sp. NPDC003717 TaxID=3154276 RepID=UPI0033BADFF0